MEAKRFLVSNKMQKENPFAYDESNKLSWIDSNLQPVERNERDAQASEKPTTHYRWRILSERAVPNRKKRRRLVSSYLSKAEISNSSISI